ncbi:hypothetical protein X953_16730 [Virgibacillus sp. SK37]|nr:hypothetical protein X953_16730 [Virgibacillus sp. SK37]
MIVLMLERKSGEDNVKGKAMVVLVAFSNNIQKVAWKHLVYF